MDRELAQRFPLPGQPGDLTDCRHIWQVSEGALLKSWPDLTTLKVTPETSHSRWESSGEWATSSARAQPPKPEYSSQVF